MRLDPSLCLVLTVLVWLVSVCNGSHDSVAENLPASSCGQSQNRHLYVSTVDGALTALNEQGHILWTYNANNPLFFSSLSRVESDNDLSEQIIPSLDRGIYHWDGTKLSQLPFTADDLVDHTHLHKGHKSILAGAKTNDVVGINLHTGKPIYECTHIKCHRYDNQSLIQHMDVLKLSTSRVTVREASDLTGEEIWNFTVGDVELVLVEGEDEEQQQGGHSCNLFHELEWELHVDALLGLVYSTHRANSEEHLWEAKLGAPVVRAWLHEGGKLESLSLSQSLERIHPSLMMVHYDNQYYLQPVGLQGVESRLGTTSTTTTTTTTVAGTAVSSAGVEKQVLQAYSRHFSLGMQFTSTKNFGASSEVGKEPKTSVMLYYNRDSFMEMCTDGPYGLAVYFYMDPLPYEDYSSSSSSEDNNSDDSERSEPPNLISPGYESSEWHWLIRKLFSVVKYLLFGSFVLACNKLRRYVKVQRHNSNSSSTDGIDDDEFPLLDKLVSTIKRHSSLSSDSASTPIVRMPSFPSSSTETIVGLSRSDSIPEARVLPRFGSDYELKGRLGKGGFGVVYHVQNKTDGGEYAVKRIKLPAQKAAMEKVMREVRALAQLDHPRIVRYYNSWVEKAPVDWNEMEEWMPMSRRPSYIQEQVSSSVAPMSSSSVPYSIPALVPPSLARLSGHSQNISPCPSFNSLNHSTIHSVVPPLSSDSRSSSFVIEFKDDSLSQVNCDGSVNADTQCKGGSHHINGQTVSDLAVSGVSSTVSDDNAGCFSRALLRNRDDLSSTGDSQSTADKEEGRDSVADLSAEPPTYLFIQMQLCQKESLKDWLKSNVTNRCHGKVLHFFDQILDAVMYVHSKGMMHRDLKPSNIFFSLEGNVKVGDFGLVTSSLYGGLQNSYLTLKGLAEEQQYRQHTGNLGTHFYMSPEQVSGRKYDHKVDIFSLGVIFFELHYPFHTDMERAKVLEDVRQHRFPSNFEAKLPLQAELVKWLMSHHPSERPVVKDICASEKFKQLQKNVMDRIPKL